MVFVDAADAIIERGRNLIALFDELDVPKDKYLLRIPATWAGVQVCLPVQMAGLQSEASNQTITRKMVPAIVACAVCLLS